MCDLIGGVLSGPGERPAGRKSDGTLWRACEPACGSGALILGFIRGLSSGQPKTSLAHWSISAIDLDPLCARICAAQVLANLLIHGGSLGELVVYQGNALGPAGQLRVVIHATAVDQTPDLILPALHPSRLAALRNVASVHLSVLSEAPKPSDREAPTRLSRHRANPEKLDVDEPAFVDLFRD